MRKVRRAVLEMQGRFGLRHFGQQALGAVFISGCLFILITLCGLRAVIEVPGDAPAGVTPH